MGGPEDSERPAERRQPYVAVAESDEASVLRVAHHPQGVPAGMVAFRDRAWRGEAVSEIGWSVLPQHPGRWMRCNGWRLPLVS